MAGMEASILALPSACLDRVFSKLSREELYTASLVCHVWRWLPANQLEVLTIDERLSCPPGQLQHMRLLQGVTVRSIALDAWSAWAAALQQRPPPGLRRLTLQFTSNLTSADLELVERVMRVQARGCVLRLCLTSVAGLRLLLPRLPWPWALHLDFNVPYLSADAPALLQQLLEVQSGRAGPASAAVADAATTSSGSTALTAPTNIIISSSSNSSSSGGATAMLGGQSVGPCTISVWVCCWGGCQGLPVQSALQLSQCCPPGALVGLESLNCGATPALVKHLTALTGLTALGLNFVEVGKRGHPAAAAAVGGEDVYRALLAGDAAAQLGGLAVGDSHATHHAGLPAYQQQQQQQQQQQPGSAAAAASNATSRTSTRYSSSSSSSDDRFSLKQLAHLAGPLRELSLYGSPRSGWAGAEHLTALRALTSLTLQRDMCAAPLDLAPLSVLTGLQVLHLERKVVQGTSLVPLGQLTGLTKLSIVLDVEPMDLGEAEPWGQMQAAFGGLAPYSGSEDEWEDEEGSGRARRGSGWGEEEGDWDAGDDCIINGIALWWLRGLKRLQQLTLEVPEVDLSDLPASLVDLDLQKHDTMGTTHVLVSGWVCLPYLRRAALPRPLASARQRQLGGVLVALATGAPRLRELDLFRWPLPAAAVEEALPAMPCLRRLSVLQPRTPHEEQRLRLLVGSRGQQQEGEAAGVARGRQQQLQAWVYGQAHQQAVQLTLYPPLPRMFWA